MEQYHQASPYPPVPAAGWYPPGSPPPPAPDGVPWGRYYQALRRHALLILVLVIVGSALGLFAAKRVRPVYDAQATIWINTGNAQQGGPIRGQQFFAPTSWLELLRSFAIIDPVVRNLRLNVWYNQPRDSILFRNFESKPALRPGVYVLTVDHAKRYVLSLANGTPVDRGAIGDSIGRNVGFGWAPDALLLPPGRVLSFAVTTPRNMSLALLSRMRTSLPEDGQFLSISLSGSDGVATARTLNAWADQFVSSSGDLKKRHLLEFKKLLGNQLSVTERELRSSESQLEQFRVHTITLPSGTPLTGGAGATRDPVITNYFQQKETLDQVRNDRIALEQMIANAKGGPLNTQAFLLLPSILNNTPQLRTAIEELSSRQAALRTEQQFLTDANPRIQQLNAAVSVLERETIPRIAQSVLQSLVARERELGSRVDTQSDELRGIPARTIEEMRLVRQMSASENLYNTLKARYEEVSLAEAQTTPDVSILDFAIPPTHPSSNEAPRLLLLAVLASIGVAVGLALLHDRLDRRFRYPEEATHELGLSIAAAVPRFSPNSRGDFQVAMMSQAVESFRTLRLAVRYEFPGDAPIVLTVTSAGAEDGKSLVSSNLALAFASAGHRTLLIDGDLRRGTQHSTFDVSVTPGLVEYLQNAAGVDSVVRATSCENLFLLPRGTRRGYGPELLVSQEMSALVQETRQKFDVVIIDSPPFIAGVDAYALGAAAGSVLIVLRQGVSDRKLAAAKLEVLDRLPIRILGAVLNGVPVGGMYRYYATDYSYANSGIKEPIGNLATPKGLVLRAS